MIKARILLGVALSAAAIAGLTQFFQKPSKDLIAINNIEEPTETWREFISPDNNFKVLLPTMPQRAAQTFKDPKTNELRYYDMYVAEKDNGTLFMISKVTLVGKKNFTIDDETVSKILKDLVNSTPNSKLKKILKGTFKDYSSLDFSIENEQINIDGKAFIVGPTLYMLTLVSKSNVYHPKEFEEFSSSFHLIDQGSEKQQEVKNSNQPEETIKK